MGWSNLQVITNENKSDAQVREINVNIILHFYKSTKDTIKDYQLRILQIDVIFSIGLQKYDTKKTLGNGDGNWSIAVLFNH